MACIKMNFFSDALGQNTTVNVFLPESDDENVKTLWLLHGLNGNQDDWMEKTSVARYAANNKIAVVMPSGDRCWYTDTAFGKKYFTFITEELVAVCHRHFKNLSTKREDNMLGGLSMGGYGAVKAAYTCPETFGYCGSLSGSLDVTRKNRTYRLEEWQGIFGFDIKSAEELEGSKHDLFTLPGKLQSENREFPKTFMWCGTEDTLLDINKAFSALLDSVGAPHEFRYSEGNHSWKWWDMHVQPMIKFFVKN